jgi:uncharacterized membrane protein YhaH (DUF805 family)
MSKPIFSDVFQFSGRRNRKSCVLIQLVTFAAMAATLSVAILGVGLYGSGGATAVGASALIFVGFAGFVAALVAAWATSAQRVRDIGYAGPWCLVQLLPYVGLIAGLFILFAAGDTRVTNKYGPSEILDI